MYDAQNRQTSEQNNDQFSLQRFASEIESRANKSFLQSMFEQRKPYENRDNTF